MYTLEHVSRNYGKVSALRDITCAIPTDRFVSVVGPSGSGKSTLLRLLSFVELPTSGTIRLDLEGLSYTSGGKARPWPAVTAVFQRQFLWPHLTLRQNICLPLAAGGMSDITSRLQHVVELFDMEDFIDRYSNEVSGGQATRVALARAFVLEPRLILIDEPHGGLDPEQQAILNSYLLKLRKAGVGLVVVTHSLDFAKKYADRVVVIEDGEVVEEGSSTLFTQPRSRFLKNIVAIP